MYLSRWLAGLAAMGVVGAATAQVPTLSTETVAAPVRTARTFATGVGPNPRGGWNFIGLFMNYKYTSGREIRKVDLPNGRQQVEFVDTAGRPDAEWVVLDLQTGRQQIYELPGFHGYISQRAENGRVFFAIDFAQFAYYDPQDERIHMLGQVFPWPDSHTRSSYKMVLGQDGNIYSSMQSYDGMSSLVQINPDTLAVKTWDQLGTGKREGLTYGYYIATDLPWVYLAVGQGDWELVALNVETGEERILAERGGDGSRVIVNQNPVMPTAELILKDRPKEVVWLVDGQAVPVVAGQQPPGAPLSQKTYQHIPWTKTKPIDLGPAPELDVPRIAVEGDGTAVVPWRMSETEPWRTTKLAIRKAEPVTIESLALLPDGTLMGNGIAYNGFFRLDPQTGKFDYFGKHGPSRPRTAVMDGKLYFSGYPNMATYEYDPTKPWTATGDTPAENKTVNPHNVAYLGQGTTEGHYTWYLQASPQNGRLYFAGHRERWSTGAALGWLNPATGEKFGLGTEHKEVEPDGLLVMPGLNRVLLPINPSVAGLEGEVVVYDLELKELERIKLERGLTGGGGVWAADQPERFLGVLHRPEAAPRLYLYDLAQHKLLQEVPAPGEPEAIVRRPVDGTFWLLTNDTLYRLDPRTLATKAVGRPTRMPGHPVWLGQTLYGTVEGEVVRVAVPE